MAAYSNSRGLFDFDALDALDEGSSEIGSTGGAGPTAISSRSHAAADGQASRGAEVGGMVAYSNTGGLFDVDALEALDEGGSEMGSTGSAASQAAISGPASGVAEVSGMAAYSNSGGLFDFDVLDALDECGSEIGSTGRSHTTVDASGCVEEADMLDTTDEEGGSQSGSRGEPSSKSSSGGGASGGSSTGDGTVGGGQALAGLSVKELRDEMQRLGMDASGCIEKADLVARLEQAGWRQIAAAGPGPAAVAGGGTVSRGEPGHPSSSSGHGSGSAGGGDSTGDCSVGGGQALAGLGVKELQAEMRRLGVDASGCIEKADLVARLEQAGWRHSNSSSGGGSASGGAGSTSSSAVGGEEYLRRCPICLDDLEEGDPEIRRCDGCRAGFHQRCAAGHALAAAEAAQLPLLCPIPTCGCRWNANIVKWALDEAELEKYNKFVRGVREMRRGSAAGPAGSSRQLSPRTTDRLRNLGIRACPHCGAHIQKREDGCDKMTCRCGCRFCFNCGVTAGPDGAARCSCAGDHHDFPHLEEIAEAVEAAAPFVKQAVHAAMPFLTETFRAATSDPPASDGPLGAQGVEQAVHAAMPFLSEAFRAATSDTPASAAPGLGAQGVEQAVHAAMPFLSEAFRAATSDPQASGGPRPGAQGGQRAPTPAGTGGHGQPPDFARLFGHLAEQVQQAGFGNFLEQMMQSGSAGAPSPSRPSWPPRR